MRPSGVHLLLTYQCTLECDHCFVWGSPWQTGTMSLRSVRHVIGQAADLGYVEWFYFEGGEPFLYYAVLLAAVGEAAALGLKVGIVSNAFWATTVADARQSLAPFQSLVQHLSLSNDAYHGTADNQLRVDHAAAAAAEMGIPCRIIQIAEPEVAAAAASAGQLPEGQSTVMYRGRAAAQLAHRSPQRPWDEFAACPYENLTAPGRVHIDPLGNLQVCQGLTVGNVFDTPLHELCRDYDPEGHPVLGPLVRGGPAELIRAYDLPHDDAYADACHLCDRARRRLRRQYGDVIGPDQMYEVV